MIGLKRIITNGSVLLGFFFTTTAFCGEPVLQVPVADSAYHELQSTLPGKLPEILAASQRAWAAYIEEEKKSLVYIDRNMVLELGCFNGDHSGNPYSAILANLHKWRKEELERFREKKIISGMTGGSATIGEQKAAIEELHGNVIYYLPESYRKYAYMSQKAWEVFFTSNSAFLEQLYADEEAIVAEKRRMMHERRSVLYCQLQSLHALRTEPEE